MSDNLFNYTFNINSQSTQDGVLEAINRGRFATSVPKSYFFADLSVFPNQVTGDAFGPVPTDQTNQFRITSKFNITAPTKAYATTDGHLFFAPHGNDTTKVNIFLRPSKPVDVGVKIKYFVYRGILKANIFTDAGGSGNLKLINHDPTTNLAFVNRVWNEYKEFNNLTNSTDPIEFKAKELGYDATNPNDLKIIKTFFKNNAGDPTTSYNLARVNMGDQIGFFGPTTMGFEIVVDFGDYEQETAETGFDLDFAYASATECVLNISGSNPAFVAGNIPAIPSIYAGINPKIFRENIYHFIDPAAFYGAHITHNKEKKEGKILTNTVFATDKDNTFQESVYSRILQSKFFTANTIYLYIFGKRGRSYNFYNETPLTSNTGPIQPAPDVTFPSPTPPVYPPPQNFETFGWPILIIDNLNNTNYLNDIIRHNADNTTNPDASKKAVNFFLDYFQASTNGDLSTFYLRNALNVCRFIKFDGTDPNPNHLRIHLESPFSFSNNNLPISNFLYASYNRTIDYLHYYNNLLGPIDVSGIYEPEDFETAQGSAIQWLIYNKPKMYHIANSNILGEMKVVFEGSGTNATRLYMIYPTDSDDPNFIKRYPFVSGCDIVDDANTFAKVVYDNKLNQLKNNDIRIWKGNVLDNGTSVDVLAVRNLIYDGDNVSNFIQLGLTQAEFDTLSAGAPDVLRFNSFFHLNEIAVVSIDNYKKYQLGITYENISGTLVTYVNATTPVFVYSIDGKFFSTSTYAQQFAHSETFANVAVEFLPFSTTNANNIWDGDYGFDWMRKTTGGVVGLNYRFPPFSTIMGTIPTQTDGNDPATGTFVPDTVMYNNLKVGEYNAIPLNWRNGITDNDIEYFTAWLSISKGQDHTVALSMKIGNTVPTSLTLKFYSNIFQLSSPNAVVQSVPGAVDFEKTLSFNVGSLPPNSVFTSILRIEYLDVPSTVNSQEQFVVMATNAGSPTGRIAGILNLFTKTRQNKLERKPLKINFVPVSVNLPGIPVQYSEGALTGIIPTLKSDLERFLDHAQIKAEVIWTSQLVITDNLANCLDPQGVLLGNPGIPIGNSLTNELHIYLKEKLKTRDGDIYGSFMTIFFINTPGGIRNPNNTTTVLGGYSSGIGSDIVVFRLNANNRTTVSHEVLHSLGVPHTFDKTSDESLFVYKGYGTENIMDYTDPAPPAPSTPIQTPVISPKHSTFHWQWLLARKNIGRK
ncbi:hypothetical protein [Flavobacterium sp. UBA7682]|uniref:hypothetical protein n=1 Tax=Flavobacterium sp. UBA7682 TaxID=1946560 RepID=UPI0025BCFB62|nr:hypothetical protein [Flavobacterium sp. UBA7682]